MIMAYHGAAPDGPSSPLATKTSCGPASLSEADETVSDQREHEQDHEVEQVEVRPRHRLLHEVEHQAQVSAEVEADLLELVPDQARLEMYLALGHHRGFHLLE